jgi:hypothetical protein
VETLLGQHVVDWHAAVGGYTPAERWDVRGHRGASAFAKVGVDASTGLNLRREHYIYSTVHAPFVPKMLGWDDDGGRPILLLEDLSGAAWPPPWTPQRIMRVVEVLRGVAATPPPDGLRDLETFREDLSGWGMVAADPEPFLSLGLYSRAWLASALPTLLAAQAMADLAGDHLVHFDMRSDNLCFAGERTLLIDWNGACRGNGVLDLASWLPSLQMEGGPAPEALLPDAAPFAALVSGYFASRAGLPLIPTAPRVRDVQLRQLLCALPWAVRSLGLPPPQSPS